MPDSIFDKVDQARRIAQAAQDAGVRPELVHALIGQESTGNTAAVSKKGAVGLMQVMPAVAASPGFGVEPFDPQDPEQNLKGGIALLKAHLTRYGGDESKALAAYNAGAGAVDSGRAASFPETQNYVGSISRNAGQAPSIFDMAAKARESASTASATQSTGEPTSLMGDWANDARNTAGALYHGVTNPTKSLQAGVGVVGGALQKVLPAGVMQKFSDTMGKVNSAILPASWMDNQKKPGEPINDLTPYADAVKQYATENYGSVGAAAHSLAHKPFSTLMDAASVAGLAGGVAKVGGLAKIGGALGTVADTIDPLQMAIRGVSKTIQPLARQTAEHIANVSLQVPKADRRRALGRATSPAEDVLNENRGWASNPATRFTQGALDKAKGRGEVMTDQFNALLDKDLPKKYPITSIEQILEDQKNLLGHDINAQPKQAQVQSVLDNLRGNPLYSKDQVGTVLQPRITQVPHPFAVDAAGNPIMQSQTVMTPTQQVTGRTLVPQTAKEINTIKGNVDKGLTFGERGGTLEEAQKAARRGLDQIIDQNVPGADALNQRRSSNIEATKALQNAVLTRQPKRNMGLMESILAYGAPIAGVEGKPLLAAAMMAPAFYNTVVKHPFTASLASTPLWAAGHYTTPATVRALERVAAPASRVDEATKNADTYELNQPDLVNWFKGYLGRQNK